MIRQAISCDVCGAEKKQTNHWFVVCEQASELRVSGWNSRNRLRPNSKHLCGQTCLHKLIDEFLARTVAGRPAVDVSAAAVAEEAAEAKVSSHEAPIMEESSARLIPRVEPERKAAPAPIVALPPRIAEMPKPIVVPRMEENAAEAARRKRAEAWERERARELRVVERRPN